MARRRSGFRWRTLSSFHRPRVPQHAFQRTEAKQGMDERPLSLTKTFGDLTTRLPAFSCQDCRRRTNIRSTSDQVSFLPSGPRRPDPRLARSHIQQSTLRMRQHRPEAAQRRGRDARPEGRDIAFEVCAQEILAPGSAVRSLSAWKLSGKPPLSHRSFILSWPTSSSRSGGMSI